MLTWPENPLLDEQQRDLARRVLAFARDEVGPLAKEADESLRLHHEVFRRMAAFGLYRHVIPEEYGGDGVSSVRVCLIREILASVSTHADTTFAMQGLGTYPIVSSGSEAQKRKYLPPIATGEAVAALGMTEPGAGSDVAGITTTARREGDVYILNGEKLFISNAGDATQHVVLAKTDPEAGGRGLSAFVVEAGTPGFEAVGGLELLGAHPIGSLHFRDCRVPADNRLGEEGEGFRIAMRNLDVYRTSVGAAACGMARAALDEALTYGGRRHAFGQAITDFQATQFRLADMATSLEAARLLVYSAAVQRDRGLQPVTVPASMAKLFATEAAFSIVDQALQLHGGHGLIRGARIEGLFREVRALRIYEGTSEIQRLVIGRELVREHARPS
jgi:acyl-CoA dehydrogenase